jgi:hypothetical protein
MELDLTRLQSAQIGKNVLTLIIITKCQYILVNVLYHNYQTYKTTISSNKADDFLLQRAFPCTAPSQKQDLPT